MIDIENESIYFISVLIFFIWNYFESYRYGKFCYYLNLYEWDVVRLIFEGERSKWEYLCILGN